MSFAKREYQREYSDILNIMASQQVELVQKGSPKSEYHDLLNTMASQQVELVQKGKSKK